MKTQVRSIVWGIFGIIVAIILIRVLLKFIGASESAAFVSFWYSLSENFVAAFRGIYPFLEPISGRVILEVPAVIAMLIYALVGILIGKLVSSFLEGDKVLLLSSVIDSLFKLAEFFLIGRFILKLTGATETTPFVNFMYAISSVVYEPFAGILPSIRIGEYNILFETSTLIAIIIVIIFDLVSEGIIANLRSGSESKQMAVMKPMAPAPMPMQMPSPFSGGHSSQTTAPAQNITINMPQPQQAMPQQPPVVVDRRTVQVIHPQQPHVYPGYNQNDLNQQRPGQLPPQQGNYQQPNAYNNYPNQYVPPGPRNS